MDCSKRTPLLLATEKGHEPVVRLLLGHNADVETNDDDGETPLSWAAKGTRRWCGYC
jgi:ankyrin repeat protein